MSRPMSRSMSRSKGRSSACPCECKLPGLRFQRPGAWRPCDAVRKGQYAGTLGPARYTLGGAQLCTSHCFAVILGSTAVHGLAARPRSTQAHPVAEGSACTMPRPCHARGQRTFWHGIVKHRDHAALDPCVTCRLWASIGAQETRTFGMLRRP